MKREGLGTKQANGLPFKDSGRKEDVELQPGLEFDSVEEAQGFYSAYAARAGFKIRVGQLYRSRADGLICSRRFVCSKEGFQTESRIGCPAFIRVQKKKSGKWTIATIKMDHNHELNPRGDIHLPTIQNNAFPVAPQGEIHSSTIPFSTVRSLLQEDGNLNLTDVVGTKRSRIEEGEAAPVDLNKGTEFDCDEDAYNYYCSYAARMGFKVRAGPLLRSKNDGLITAKVFMCSEGHGNPSRVHCGAFLRIIRQDSGKWVVDRLNTEHSHSLLGSPPIDDTNNEIDTPRQNNIGDDWYSVLLPYFQSRQAVDTGFFYALEVDEGKCGSLFWADGRSRFLCSQFGDAIVFDTSYRSGNQHAVPFAFFIGVNHHRQPVLLGCALIAHESEKCFSWVFQTWIRAMSSQPLSMIADQDMPIQRSIAKVFPETHHRFSASQIKANELQHLGPILSNNNEFKYEYTICVSMSRTPSEFDSSWNQLLNKYQLEGNAWLNEMYQMRKSWVPLYIKGTFFAGILMDDGNTKSFFGNFLNAQSPSNEFITRYERAVNQSREEQRKEDYNSFSSKIELHTKDPIEEQGRLHYTNTMFKVFQKELLECYSYVAVRINGDGAIHRYMVHNCGNGMDDRHTVAINCSNLNASCSCMMFEFQGMLCRHALKIFQVMNIRELPSRYILHRWTKNAKSGAPRDMDAVGEYADARTLMLWSLREESCNYIQAGVNSHEQFKIAFEILYEGRRARFGQTEPVKP